MAYFNSSSTLQTGFGTVLAVTGFVLGGCDPAERASLVEILARAGHQADCDLSDGHVHTSQDSSFHAFKDEDLDADFSTEALDAEEDRIHEESEALDAALSRTDSLEVIAERELLIRHLDVVNDPVRTQWTGALNHPADGAWHFGKLMTNMAGEQDPITFTRSFFEQWTADLVVNEQTVSARSAIETILDDWEKTADGELDLTQAPFRLLAIVNRMDLRHLSQGDAGEGRFVFGLVNSDGEPLKFVVILEYKLPATTRAEMEEWAQDWHELGDHDPSTETYRTKLQNITERFAAQNARPGHPNGSAIGQVRSNEIALGGPWELREFRLNDQGKLVQTPLVNTPRTDLNGSPDLARWIKNNTPAILDESHQIPDVAHIGERNVVFRAGAIAYSDMDIWSAPGLSNPTARHKFSLNTCNGCHGGETNTSFVHIDNREEFQEARLSPFMTGSIVHDPVSGAQRSFNELQRREIDLKEILMHLASTECALERVH